MFDDFSGKRHFRTTVIEVAVNQLFSTRHLILSTIDIPFYYLVISDKVQNCFDVVTTASESYQSNYTENNRKTTV